MEIYACIYIKFCVECKACVKKNTQNEFKSKGFFQEITNKKVMSKKNKKNVKKVLTTRKRFDKLILHLTKRSAKRSLKTK